MSQQILALPLWSQDWARYRLAQHTQGGLEVDEDEWVGLRDWLESLPTQRPRMAGKLHKLTLGQALLASTRWHDEMAARQLRLAQTLHGFGGDPLAVEPVAVSTLDLPHDWRWVRVTTPAGLDYEGSAMGHCVGGGSYDDATIYSLRDEDNMPHCTIEWDTERKRVLQVQGRANKAVVQRYHSAIAAFVRTLEPSHVRGAGKFGHVMVDGSLMSVHSLEPGMVIDGDLDLRGYHSAITLPDDLWVKQRLMMAGCVGLANLPARLHVGGLYLMGCASLQRLPDCLHVEGSIDLEACTGLVELPDDLVVHGSLDIRDCTGLVSLPRDLHVDSDLLAKGCTRLRSLGQRLRVGSLLQVQGCTALEELDLVSTHLDGLDVSGCTSLKSLPPDLEVRGGMSARGCTSLQSLPPGLRVRRGLDLTGCTSLQHLSGLLAVGNLMLSDCTSLQSLPEDLVVQGYLDLERCHGLVSLPGGLQVKHDLHVCCLRLESLPQDLVVGGRIHLAGCPRLRSLPAHINPERVTGHVPRLVRRTRPDAIPVDGLLQD